ncbi:MAG: HAD family hydrolase, partial [Candidatus Gastranaerophilales bacterium]|nr:HAD family hydrolase [Candidatus Gastranaerophilales bacterium]
MRKKNTIIFDLDGTLLNTLEDLTNGFNFALKTFGYSPRTITEVQSFVGNGVQKAIEKCLPYKVSENELEKIIHTFKEYYSAHMFEKTKPYEGIIPLLETLKQEGIKTAVVSNKYDGAVKYLCNYYFKGLIN